MYGNAPHCASAAGRAANKKTLRVWAALLQGGMLYQDLPTEYGSNIEHHMKPPHTNIAHTVQICRESPLYDLLRVETLGVNSCHHQAVKMQGTNLEVMAESKDGLTEAVCHAKHKFVWAFQWHPEFDYHVNSVSRKIFEAFVNGGKRTEK